MRLSCTICSIETPLRRAIDVSVSPGRTTTGSAAIATAASTGTAAMTAAIDPTTATA